MDSTGSGEQDEKFIRRALDLAHEAALAGEVPVGAVITLDGKEIACGMNRTIRDNDPTAHAEIVALREAAQAVGNYRLSHDALRDHRAVRDVRGGTDSGAHRTARLRRGRSQGRRCAKQSSRAG
jgi:pyrimidine deaminase RibD-like protein